jgi:hypothetical protein
VAPKWHDVTGKQGGHVATGAELSLGVNDRLDLLADLIGDLGPEPAIWGW